MTELMRKSWHENFCNTTEFLMYLGESLLAVAEIVSMIAETYGRADA